MLCKAAKIDWGGHQHNQKWLEQSRYMCHLSKLPGRILPTRNNRSTMIRVYYIYITIFQYIHKYIYIYIYIYIYSWNIICIYYTILCYAILYYITLHHITSYYIILHHIILYHTILYYIISYYIILLYYIILYYILFYYILLYYIVLYYILYYTILYYIILYHIIILYYIIFLYYIILYLFSIILYVCVYIHVYVIIRMYDPFICIRPYIIYDHLLLWSTAGAYSFFKMPGSPVRRRDNESASRTWWWPGRPAPQRWSRPKTHHDDYDVTRLVWLVITCHILAQKWMKSPQKEWQFAAAPVPVLQLWFLTSDSRTANTSSTL